MVESVDTYAFKAYNICIERRRQFENKRPHKIT